jgi:hypothetical protein
MQFSFYVIEVDKRLNLHVIYVGRVIQISYSNV